MKHSSFVLFAVGIGFIFLVLLMSFFAFASAQDEELTLEANLIGPIVMIEAPDNVFLGNVSKGENSDWTNITITNKGNVKVFISAEIISMQHNIFEYLEFDTTTESIRNITSFNTTIAKPPQGGIINKIIDLRLNLEDYPYEVEQDALNQQSRIKFIAMGA